MFRDNSLCERHDIKAFAAYWLVTPRLSLSFADNGNVQTLLQATYISLAKHCSVTITLSGCIPYLREVIGRRVVASSKLPKPSCPWRPRPHAQSSPFSQMASEWLPPALTDSILMRNAGPTFGTCTTGLFRGGASSDAMVRFPDYAEHQEVAAASAQDSILMRNAGPTVGDASWLSNGVNT